MGNWDAALFVKHRPEIERMASLAEADLAKHRKVFEADVDKQIARARLPAPPSQEQP